MAAIVILKTPGKVVEDISSGLVVWPGGINITNQLSDTFAILDAPGLEGAHINGQKYNRTNSKGQVVYDLIIPHRENHLVLDIAKVKVKQNCRAMVNYCTLPWSSFLCAVYN